jgi:hypothetical protein
METSCSEVSRVVVRENIILSGLRERDGLQFNTMAGLTPNFQILQLFVTVFKSTLTFDMEVYAILFCQGVVGWDGDGSVFCGYVNER